MKIERIGFMTPGDMGQAVAMQIKAKGFTVFTALGKRSERSRKMAAEVGLIDLGSIEKMTAECDLIMSVMNPGAGLEFATEAAAAIQSQQRKPVFIDCNAVAPDTMYAIDKVIRAAGSRCLDGGIIGPPPRGGAKTNLYVSGPGAADLKQLENDFLRVHILTEKLGDASAVKMCYSAFNKGTQGLVLQTLMAAQRLGVQAIVEQQLLASRADAYESFLKALPQLPSKAYRWVPEMYEIARTFEGVGMTPRIFQGEADMFELVAATKLGKETPETRDKSRTGRDVVKQLADDRK
jgi:3-hydroxyisobutyrate dehydrogenase-like beta-hydroxyacid dehydrogenase